MPPLAPHRQNRTKAKKGSAHSQSNQRNLWAIILLIFLGFITGVFLKYRPDQFVCNCFHTYINQICSQSGMVLKKIDIFGNQRIKKEEIISFLELKMNTSLYDIHLETIKEKLEKISWIQKASVYRKWPHTVIISIEERKPFALWQINNKLHLVDPEGVIIPTPHIQEFYYLPHIIGQDAPKTAKNILNIITKYPKIKNRITSYIYMSQRRWDLIIDRTIRIKLPQNNLENALSHLENLEEKGHIDKDNVVSIDVRIENRTYFELTSHALTHQLKKGG